MNIQKATQGYETWLARQTAIVQADLKYKHAQMAVGVFPFLRATYYRWAQVFPKLCPELTDAPHLLAIGDLHVANFGTWRDAEGRLIWGVNDFDEATKLPYVNDLVRLAVSVNLAGGLHSGPDASSCAALLDGYAAGLSAGGRAYVLAEDHGWLRDVARQHLLAPVTFWQKMRSLPEVSAEIPAGAHEGIETALPSPLPSYQIARRRAGLGSLGHPRFVGLAQWAGGMVAREAKALVPSAALWAANQDGPHEILYGAIVARAVRCQDPFLALRGQWILRRLAPDCARIPLEVLDGEKGDLRLLHAMGWETANIHLGTRSVIPAIRQDLAKRPKNWLASALSTMTESVESDWTVWKKEYSA